MVRCVLIDDEPLARSIVKEYLSAYKNEIEISAECGNGFEGVKAVMEHKPDLIFLDIQMPKISGFEMLELLDPAPAVIFTTAFDEYALKAFEHHAVDYLLKPFSKDRFDKALNKFLEDRKNNSSSEKKNSEEKYFALSNETQRQPEERERIVVKINGEIRIVPTNDIYYLEAFDDYVKIITKDSWFLKKKTMTYFEKTLDPSKFVRVHRSYLINLSNLTRVEPYEKGNHIALLKNGSKIPLSRTGYNKLKEVLGI